jgi:hypothetical protein
MLKKLNKMHPSSIGFFQALGVAVYCFAFSSFAHFCENLNISLPQPVGIAFFLFLFVVSATLTGLLVLGYPLYLALKQEIKRALAVIGFTLGFAFFFILLAVFIISF